ncbi:MAG: hypothetical protein U0003_04235 [Vampirovibrionales bacterium]
MKRLITLIALATLMSSYTALAAETTTNPTINPKLQQTLQMLNTLMNTPTPATTTPAATTTGTSATSSTTTTATTATTPSSSTTPSTTVDINSMASSLLKGQPVITQLQTENTLLKEQVVGLYTMQIKGVDNELTALKAKMDSLTAQKAQLEKNLQTLTPNTTTTTK